MEEITMPSFQTPYFRKEDIGEKFSQKCCVELGTYQDPKKQIEAFIMAGQKLGDFRSGNYDLSEDEDDDERNIGPRNPNYDFVDAQADCALVVDNFEKKKSEKTASSEAEKKSEVSEKVDTSEPKTENTP